jgi:hypothetical protein
MHCDQRIDGTAQLAECAMRADLVFAHQPAEPDHIGMQYRSKLAPPRGGLRRRPRRRIEHVGHGGAF